MTPQSNKAACDEPLMTTEQTRQFLIENGFPISASTFRKLCAPSVNQGPPVEAWWGKHPMRRPSHALEWARSRLTSHPSRIHPGSRQHSDQPAAAHKQIAREQVAKASA